MCTLVLGSDTLSVLHGTGWVPRLLTSARGVLGRSRPLLGCCCPTAKEQVLLLVPQAGASAPCCPSGIFLRHRAWFFAMPK